MKNILICSANLGGFDKEVAHVPQSIDADYHIFTDANFPPRDKAMTPRLQAKIPKCFAWQIKPGYEYYMWLDSNITLSDKDSIKYFLDNCKDHDIVTLKHPKRNTVKWEARYVERGMKEKSLYLVNRYNNEFSKEEMEAISSDKDFVDDMLVIGGIFLYRNTEAVQKMLKEWFHFISRYNIMDQCSLSYCLKKSGIKIKALDDVYNKCRWISLIGHNYHSK